MWSLLEIVLPVCALVAIGFAARNTGIVKPSADDVIGDFVFKIALPVLLFHLVVTSDLKDVNPWSIWGAYFIAVFIVWTIAAIVLPLVFKREVLYGVIGGAASGFANTVLIGVPIVLQAYGKPGLVSVSILLSVHLPVLLLATTLHHDLAQWIDGEGGIEGEGFFERAKRFILSIIKNPILIGIALGGIVQMSGLSLPALFLDVTGKIAGIAGPLALIILGMGLQKYGITGNIGPAFFTTFLKLAVLPGLVFALSVYVFELPPLFTAGLVVAASAPSGVNSYLFAQHFGTGQALSANSISISTLLSIVTMTFWLAVLKVYVI